MVEIQEKGDLNFQAPVLTALGLGMIVCAGFKVQDIRPIVNPPIRDANLDVQENSATASLVGQFRSTASGWLWLRADLYLHNGVEMRPVSESEKKKGVTVENAKEDGNEKLHQENEVSAVPSKDRDFRGVFGDVERQVASFKDMHNHGHNDPKVAMPLYRLMTWIDPQFVQGWTMGGMILARDHSPAGAQRSISYLEEGWQANPDCVEIPSQIGSTIAARKGNLDDSIRYLEAARKAGDKRGKDLGESEQEALRATYRFLAIMYRDRSRFDIEARLLAEGIEKFPDDLVLPKLAAQMPHGTEKR